MLIQKIEEGDNVMLVDIIPAAAVKTAVDGGAVEGGSDVDLPNLPADVEMTEVLASE